MRTLLDPFTRVVQSGHFRPSLGARRPVATRDTNAGVVGVDDGEIQAGDCIAAIMIRRGEMHEWRCIIARRCCGICSPAQSEERTQSEHQELPLPETVLCAMYYVCSEESM